MVIQASGVMSIPATVSIDNQLPASWMAHYNCADVSMVTSGYTSRLWSQDHHPQNWTKYQVWEWLQQMLDMHQIDATSIPFQNFDFDGRQLCNMSFQDFTRAAGSVGSILFQSLTDLKWNGQYGQTDMFIPGDIKTEIDADFPCSILPFKEEPSFYSPSELFDIKSSFQPNITLTSPAPSSPDPKRSQVKRHNPRGTHLWEFIRDILLNPERNPGLIKWEDRSEGVFRFLKSEAVAQLWGKKKNNSSMTYEKLSRAMRYYYKREILERVDGRRLVYKFGRNARGWRESEK
ncbi:ETS homologous factor isoform X1 [Rhinichthys klamathensis goyatoka]|uniref:ETS homologous factor isoform X1 n=1 Tax=Rhinichthys klamathensis goyatoka TaxID=3034132 RepID=UPI0024B5049E|nr:ETS homologous factor isoform X1 [Rhinichthys klamathensis goyatoka]